MENSRDALSRSKVVKTHTTAAEESPLLGREPLARCAKLLRLQRTTRAVTRAWVSAGQENSFAQPKLARI